jgi:hypothetical protein
LQENSMPKKLPDGRTESPGVLRIYLSSLIILALFYACSTVVGLILRSVATILRAVGVAGEIQLGGGVLAQHVSVVFVVLVVGLVLHSVATILRAVGVAGEL